MWYPPSRQACRRCRHDRSPLQDGRQEFGTSVEREPPWQARRTAKESRPAPDRKRAYATPIPLPERHLVNAGWALIEDGLKSQSVLTSSGIGRSRFKDCRSDTPGHGQAIRTGGIDAGGRAIRTPHRRSPRTGNQSLSLTRHLRRSAFTRPNGAPGPTARSRFTVHLCMHNDA